MRREENSRWRPVQRPQTVVCFEKMQGNAVTERVREGGRGWLRNVMITGYGST